MLKILIQHRRFIIQSSIYDLRDKYVGTSIGLFWNIIGPLIQILIFTLVFSRIMEVKIPSLPSHSSFTIYLCLGLLPWIAFSECITRGSNSIVENAVFLKKLPIPEEVFIVKVSLSSFFSMIISMTVLFIYIFIIGGDIFSTWLITPVICFLFIFLGFGISYILSVLNVFFRDISQIVNLFIQLWMWLTPIVYTVDIVPKEFLSIIYLNPVYYYITSIRDAVLYNQMPNINQWLILLTCPFIVILIANLLIKKLKSEIKDAL